VRALRFHPGEQLISSPGTPHLCQKLNEMSKRYSIGERVAGTAAGFINVINSWALDLTLLSGIKSANAECLNYLLISAGDKYCSKQFPAPHYQIKFNQLLVISSGTHLLIEKCARNCFFFTISRPLAHRKEA
jgi:hypothetical protein